MILVFTFPHVGVIDPLEFTIAVKGVLADARVLLIIINVAYDRSYNLHPTVTRSMTELLARQSLLAFKSKRMPYVDSP